LKLTVRATVIALKLQNIILPGLTSHDKTKVNVLTTASEMVFKFIELGCVWLKWDSLA